MLPSRNDSRYWPMVDVEKLKQLIVAMFKKGMTIDQVKSRLSAANLQATDELINECSMMAGVNVAPQKEAQVPAPEKQGDKKEDIPQIEITSFSGGQEKTVDLSQMLGREDKGQKEAEGMFDKPNQSSFANVREVEQKLDELIFRVKALEEVNKQILSTVKELIYRSK